MKVQHLISSDGNKNFVLVTRNLTNDCFHGDNTVPDLKLFRSGTTTTYAGYRGALTNLIASCLSASPSRLVMVLVKPYKTLL